MRKRLPDWVKWAAPAVRDLVLQEYYVSPKRAKRYAAAHSLEEFYAIRREEHLTEYKRRHSNLLALGSVRTPEWERYCG